MKPTILIIYPSFATPEEKALVVAAREGRRVELLGACYSVQKIEGKHDIKWSSLVDADTADTITLELYRMRMAEQPGAAV